MPKLTNPSLQLFVGATLYPATMVLSAIGAGVLLQFYGLPILSLAVIMLAAMLLVWGAERHMPYRADWREPKQDRLTDSAYLTVNLALRELAAKIIPIVLLGLFADSAQDLATGSWWPQHWGLIFQALLAIVILDFFEYWFHRASHRWRFLWRFHAIHHSVQRLYFLNAARFHFVDWLVLVFIETAVILALGASLEVTAVAVMLIQIHGLFQHGNIDLKLGPLNYLVSGPELHRWHHSQKIQESDTNFGNNVIIWDLIFGSYFLPKDRHVGAIGLLNSAYPQRYWSQLKAAFARRPLDKPPSYYQDKVDK